MVHYQAMEVTMEVGSEGGEERGVQSRDQSKVAYVSSTPSPATLAPLEERVMRRLPDSIILSAFPHSLRCARTTKSARSRCSRCCPKSACPSPIG